MKKLKFEDIKNFIETNYEFKLLSKDYINSRSKLIVECKKCGKITERRYNDIYNKGIICKCSLINHNSLSKDEFFKRLKESKYGNEFELLEEYNFNINKPFKVKHKKCGKIISTKLIYILDNKMVCNDCNYKYYRKLHNKKTLEEIKKEVKEITFNKFKFIDTYYNDNKEFHNFQCNRCGKIIQNNFNHLKDRGISCPICDKSMSNGELIIFNYLTDRNIKFTYQKTFIDCKNKNNLYFDFYLDDLNILIEFDGKQHFIESFGCEDNLIKQKLRDDIKNKYCNDKNIKLYRINYKNNYNQIIEKINEILESSTTIP